MVEQLKCNVMDDTKTLYMSYQADGNPIVAIQDGKSETLAFAGLIEKTKFFNINSAERQKNLLIHAVNNRTRERNYFKLYCEMLDGIISEEDFDKEIDNHEEKYMINQNEDATIEDIEFALELSPQLMDVKDTNDMAELFSFSEKSMLKSISK